MQFTDEKLINLSDDAHAVAQGWSVTRYDADSATLNGADGLAMFRGTYQEIATFIMGARCGRAYKADERALHLLVMHGDVEPELLGPFKTDQDRIDRARLHRADHGDDDGLYRVDATGTVDVYSFSGKELD